MQSIFVFLTLIGGILLSLPVAFTILLAAMLSYVFIADIPLVAIGGNMFYATNSYAFSSVVYFVFAGNVMVRGDLSDRLLDIADELFGWLPGGMAIGAVVACALFGSITGSDLATLAAIGGIVVPSLIERGWDKHFAVGLAGSSALLGMIIPPSIPVIIYSLFVNVSIGKLFLAGVLPGLMIVTCFSLYIYYKSRSLPNEKLRKPNVRAILTAVRRGLWALGLPFVIFGGIYSGIFTVTEAAAVAAVYAVIVEVLIHRELKWNDLPQIAVKTAVVAATLLVLVCAATALGRYLTMEQIPQQFASSVFPYLQNKWIFLIAVNIFLLLVGCMMDLVSATMILMPILQPMYKAHGINDIHFGMIFLLNMYCGFLTPPVGINLFAASTLFKMDFVQVAKAYIPFFLILLFVLFVVVVFPAVSTWFPDLVMG